MSREVWKHNVPLGDSDYTVVLPEGARIVHVAVQSGLVTFWEEHQLGVVDVERVFQVFGTGWSVPDGYEHVGSALHGPFVWHLYERVA